MKTGDIVRIAVSILGASLMVWGVFQPMLGISFFKDESFIQLKPVGAVIIIAMAVITLVMALKKWYTGLYATGLASAGLLIYAVFVMRAQKSGAHDDLEHIADSPLRNLGSSLVDSVSLRHGWVVMMLGALVIAAVPLLGSRLAPAGKRSAEKVE
jgi:hypothetical protein